MLTDETIEKLAKPFVKKIGGDYWHRGDEGIPEDGAIEDFSRAIEAEVRKEGDAEITALKSDLSDYMAAANAEANRVDELTALRKQDEELIRQMLLLIDFVPCDSLHEQDCNVCNIIAAARLRLQEGT